MKYGLCCLFYKESIKFKTYTYKNIKEIFKKNPKEGREKILQIWQHNVESLQKAINYCKNNNIESYRISSDLLPHLDRIVNENIVLKEDLEWITNKLKQINSYDIILSMHPGQHVNIGSPSENVVLNSIQDLKNHFFISKPLKCTEINIHLGGSYGDKEKSIKRFIYNIQKHLTSEELSWITIENDELNYSIKDVINVVNILNIRATYDIHHQRCYELKNSPDGTEQEYFKWSKNTWKNYPYVRMHISTPKDGYTTCAKSRPHHDFININDLPKWLINKDFVYLDIEAKAKEVAIIQLKKDILINKY